MQREQKASYGFINKFKGVGEKKEPFFTGKKALLTEKELLLTSPSLTPQLLHYSFV
jgi:hypothetical protein